jgi:hypothetical protein
LPSWSRYLTAPIAIWLFLSAFLWRHTPVLREDAWIVGAMMLVAAVSALVVPAFRWVNTVLAAWLFFSTLFMPRAGQATLWNHLLVGIVVFALSLFPTRARKKDPTANDPTV